MDKVAHASGEIRRVAAAHGVEIGNSIACGKLEASAHAEHETALALPEQADAEVHRVYPRVLILDSTRLGSISATGQVKKRLFDGWATGRLLQIHAVGRSRLGMYRAWEPFVEATPTDEITAFEACRTFHPDVIYYRPHEKPAAFHRWAEQVIDDLGAPVVTHLMDDWIRRLGSNTEAERSLRLRLERSAACLSIGEAMSVAFQDRLGVTFQPVANCVEPDQWLALEHRRINRKPGDPVIMRYVGSLSDDMTRASLVDVARAVDNLHGEPGLVFEVHTMDRWAVPARRAFACLHGVSVHVGNLSDKAHQQLLVESDVLLIAYNFDETSVGYVRYSIANKMPECLAAGVPVLAYGPRGLATIDYLAMHGIAEVVSDRDSIGLSKALRRLITDTEYAKALGQRGREFAFKRHNCGQVRRGFHQVLCDAAGRHGWTAKTAPLSADDSGLLGTFERAERAHLDEVRWVGELLGGVTHGVMVDVGAHHGRALEGFLQRGWRVFAFEPDEKNRTRLQDLHGSRADLIVDSRAVSDAAHSRVPLYASEESTGISTLSPFVDSHRPVGMVDTTTIAQAVQQYGIQRIDLLKIDAEGYDLMVLKGVPWAAVRPPVIVCEFEDRKTLRLGYRMHDMARYLVAQGYRVWVSEWHPVVRYGIRHDWRRLVPYPCHLASADAWGNLVAFQQEMSIKTLREAASTVLQSFAVERGGESLPVTIEKVDAIQVPKDSYVSRPLASPHGVSDEAKAQSPPPSRMRALFYDQFATYLLRHHPPVARIARFVVWNLRSMRQHPVAAGACGLVVAGSLVALPWMTEHGTLLLWTAVAAICIFFGTMALSKIEGLERQFRTFNTVTASLDARLGNLDARFAELAKAEVINGRLGALETDVGKLEDDLHNVFADLDAQLRNMRGTGVNTGKRLYDYPLEE